MSFESTQVYISLVGACSHLLGSSRALARQLGISHATIARRVSNPTTIKREHLYALELLHERLRPKGY
jgi:hypothetical protein